MMALKIDRPYEDIVPREVRAIMRALKDAGREMCVTAPVWWVGHIDQR